MKFLAYMLFVVFAISGDNILLVLFCYLLAAVFGIIFLTVREVTFTYSQSLQGLAFVSMAVPPLIFLPTENVLRFFMAIYAVGFAALLYTYILTLNPAKQKRFFKNILSFFLFGSLIHASGILGDQMQIYKSLLQIPLISNLEREASLGLFSRRFFGFFSEPSYFAVHYSLLCSALFLSGAEKSAVIYFAIGFTLCPSPNFILGPAIVFYAQWGEIVLSPKKLLGGIILTSALFYLQFERLSGFYYDLRFFLDGGYRLTSFSHRLIVPIQEFSHIYKSNLIPLPYICIDDLSCSSFLMKVPIVTIWTFFSFLGVASYLLLIKIITGKSFITVGLLVIGCSIFAGGSAFMPHFALVLMTSFFALDLKKSSLNSQRVAPSLTSPEYNFKGDAN